MLQRIYKRQPHDPDEWRAMRCAESTAIKAQLTKARQVSSMVMLECDGLRSELPVGAADVSTAISPDAQFLLARLLPRSFVRSFLHSLPNRAGSELQAKNANAATG